jgi:hypothetical protein
VRLTGDLEPSVSLVLTAVAGELLADELRSSS